MTTSCTCYAAYSFLKPCPTSHLCLSMCQAAAMTWPIPYLAFNISLLSAGTLNGPVANHVPCQDFQFTPGHTGGLALQDLDSLVQFCYKEGLTSSTHRTKAIGINWFTKYSAWVIIIISNPFPLSQTLLWYFVSSFAARDWQLKFTYQPYATKQLH